MVLIFTEWHFVQDHHYQVVFHALLWDALISLCRPSSSFRILLHCWHELEGNYRTLLFVWCWPFTAVTPPGKDPEQHSKSFYLNTKHSKCQTCHSFIQFMWLLTTVVLIPLLQCCQWVLALNQKKCGLFHTPFFTWKNLTTHWVYLGSSF